MIDAESLGCKHVEQKITQKKFYNKYYFKVSFDLWTSNWSSSWCSRKANQQTLSKDIFDYLDTTYPDSRKNNRIKSTETYKVVEESGWKTTVFTTSQKDAEAIIALQPSTVSNITSPTNDSHINTITDGKQYEVRDRLWFGCYRYKLKFNVSGKGYRERDEFSKEIKEYMENSYPDIKFHYQGKLGTNTWKYDLYLLEEDEDVWAILSLMFDVNITKAVTTREMLDAKTTQ